MNEFIVTSYFTVDTDYSLVCHKYLMPTVQKLGLKADIARIFSRGSWQKNTAYKPEFLGAMMEKHTENIVFLDVDAEIMYYPVYSLISQKSIVWRHIFWIRIPGMEVLMAPSGMNC